MAKKKGGGNQQPIRQPVANDAKAVGPAKKAAEPDSPEMTRVDAVARDEGVVFDPSDSSMEVPKNVQPMDLPEAYKRHLAAEKLYREATEKVQKRESELQKRDDSAMELEIQLTEREEKTEEVEKQLLERIKNLEDREASIDLQLNQFSLKAKSLDDREQELSKKEQDLLTGRLSEAFEMYVRPLEDKRSEILNQISEHIATTQESVRTQWTKVLSDLDAGNDEFRLDLMTKMKELDKHRTQLLAEQSSLDYEKEILEQEKAKLEDNRQKIEVIQSEELQVRKESLEIEYQAKREALLKREIEANSIIRNGEFITDWENTLGDIDGVVNEIDHLKSTIKNYELELSKRRSANDENELHSLRRQVDELTEQIAQLKSENLARSKESAAATSRYLDAEAKFDEYENLSSTIQQYKNQRDQLKADMDHLSGVKQAESPFSECSRMDQDKTLQASAQFIDDSEFKLSEFVDKMQWLLYNPRSSDHGARPLSYRKDDLRVFIAGLNASRLHILEGVSGTGKTTLPIAFVRALGGGESNVAIQAGWRDRQDLLGYFNEFQGQFRETDFLRGMYRAMTPKYKDGLYFVVLDEMNLSKVEQYFADYLKGLEDAAGADVERGGSVPLMDKSGVTMPRHLRSGENGGIELPLPPNVWFIGTANQDESTQSFAPKTQSRAHIMELPHEQPTAQQMASEIGGKTFSRFQPDSLGLETLNQAFLSAVSKESNRKKTEQSMKIFRELRQIITRIDPGLALAPRFDRQVEAFVPIIIETGGTLALAVDHLVATKFIRRMNENYKIQSSHRKTLSDSLERIWGENSLGDYSDTWAYLMLNRDEHA